MAGCVEPGILRPQGSGPGYLAAGESRRTRTRRPPTCSKRPCLPVGPFLCPAVIGGGESRSPESGRPGRSGDSRPEAAATLEGPCARSRRPCSYSSSWSPGSHPVLRPPAQARSLRGPAAARTATPHPLALRQLRHRDRPRADVHLQRGADRRGHGLPHRVERDHDRPARGGRLVPRQGHARRALACGLELDLLVVARPVGLCDGRRRDAPARPGCAGPRLHDAQLVAGGRRQPRRARPSARDRHQPHPGSRRRQGQACRNPDARRPAARRGGCERLATRRRRRERRRHPAEGPRRQGCAGSAHRGLDPRDRSVVVVADVRDRLCIAYGAGGVPGCGAPKPPAAPLYACWIQDAAASVRSRQRRDVAVARGPGRPRAGEHVWACSR